MHLLLPSHPVIFASLKGRRDGFAAGNHVGVDVAWQLSAVDRARAASRQKNFLRSLRPLKGSTPLSKHLEEHAADGRPFPGLTLPDLAMNLNVFCYACVVITLAIPRLQKIHPKICSLNKRIRRAHFNRIKSGKFYMLIS